MFRAAWIAVFLAAAPGCSFLNPFETKGPDLPPPSVDEMQAFCYDAIRFVKDSENGKRPLPGLVGKAWLFSGSEKRLPVEANGSICAELYDVTAGTQPRKLADWTFDKETLKLLKQSDKIGLGYTLFLPWETYTPEIKNVEVRLWYVEPGKQPRYADQQVIALKSPADQITPPLVQQINLPNVPVQRAGSGLMGN
jgi:hypothetical protein